MNLLDLNWALSGNGSYRFARTQRQLWNKHDSSGLFSVVVERPEWLSETHRNNMGAFEAQAYLYWLLQEYPEDAEECDNANNQTRDVGASNQGNNAKADGVRRAGR